MSEYSITYDLRENRPLRGHPTPPPPIASTLLPPPTAPPPPPPPPPSIPATIKPVTSPTTVRDHRLDITSPSHQTETETVGTRQPARNRHPHPSSSGSTLLPHGDQCQE